jgi:hypothetical protein
MNKSGHPSIVSIKKGAADDVNRCIEKRREKKTHQSAIVDGG